MSMGLLPRWLGADGAASADAGPDQQHDDCANHRSDDSGRLKESGVLVEDEIAQEAAEERAHDAYDDSHGDREVLLTGDDQPCESASDEPYDDEADEQSNHELPFVVEAVGEIQLEPMLPGCPGHGLQTGFAAEPFEKTCDFGWVDAVFAETVTVLVGDLIGELLISLGGLLMVTPGLEKSEDLLLVERQRSPKGISSVTIVQLVRETLLSLTATSSLTGKSGRSSAVRA
jgi:hypothetical protein